MAQNRKDFTKGPIVRQLLLFASPLFLSSLLQIAYNMADMVVVGHAMGKVGLSAVSVGGDVVHFLTFFAMGFANAGQVIIAQFIGAKRERDLGRFIGTMAAFLTVCAVVIGGVCLVLRRPILMWMRTPEQALSEALSYSTISCVGLVFIYGYNMVAAVLRGMGDSKHPFVFIAVASVLNVVLDVVFVMGCAMGAGGAALATVISQGVSFLLCAAFLWKRRAAWGLDIVWRDLVRMDREMLLPLLKLGFPMAIKSASIQFSKLFVNAWINSYGVEVSAFAGIANKINSISNLLSNSLNTAGSSMVGQNVGAKVYDRVPKIMLTLFAITSALATVLSVLVYAFPVPIFSCFTKDEAVLRVAMEYLPIAVLIFFGSAARSPMNALINGSGNYKVNFATAILDGIVMRIGLSALFGLWLSMGYVGFWLGDALAGFTPLWIGLVFYWSGQWKRSSVS
ncbi:MAG: MATE family efflux transporter [Clostridia bacterium]|nr:MATE family efflux transporter [Clostridia bacterium]